MFKILPYLYSREVVGIFIFAGISQKVAEMSLKKVVDRGYIFIFFIFIVFLLTNIFNFFEKSLKFQMFKFLSLIFVRFTEKVADFRKITAGIFPHSEGRLPPCCIPILLTHI